MIPYRDIREVHLEISTLCNAQCPCCPRNFHGYPDNNGYPELNFTLANAQQIFLPEFLQQLTRIRINGNFGDIVMNPDGASIVEYFRSVNNKVEIRISTNGSARDQDFWQRLAQANAVVLFALDGMSDTHSLYRQNTNWHQIIKNAKTFMAAGGHAVWRFIPFDHNRHQIDACQKLSQALGFKHFQLVDDGRDTGPVFNQKGKLTHILGNYTGEKEFTVLFHKKNSNLVMLDDIMAESPLKKIISCEAKNNQSIYIAATGEIFPCCYTGFYPNTYGQGQFHQASNAQLQLLVAQNNALEYSLDKCIAWFEKVEASWKKPSFSTGKLVVCNNVCGIN